MGFNIMIMKKTKKKNKDTLKKQTNLLLGLIYGDKISEKEESLIQKTIKRYRENKKIQEAKLKDLKKKIKEDLKIEIKQNNEDLKIEIKQKNFTIETLQNQLEKVKYNKHKNETGIELKDHELQKISYSLVNLKLIHLKKLTKTSLLKIILQRETLLNNKINEFNESLKYNDREVFKNLREQINELNNYLLDNNKGYKDLLKLKKDYNILNNKLNIARSNLKNFKIKK